MFFYLQQSRLLTSISLFVLDVCLTSASACVSQTVAVRDSNVHYTSKMNISAVIWGRACMVPPALLPSFANPSLFSMDVLRGFAAE